MNILFLLLLCLIQASTEFLPVSSSGHLLLLEKLFNYNDNYISLNLFLHLATLFAVVIYYRKTIFELLKKPFQPLTYKLALSTIITIIFAFMYEHFNLSLKLDKYFGFYFLITATILLVTYLYKKKSVILNVNGLTYRHSAIVGLSQTVAILPGISRSGATISTMLLLGNNEKDSSEFSFLLSIPIIIGGFIFEIVKINDFNAVFNIFPLFYLIIAFFITFFISLISLKLMIKFINNNKFIYFSIYLYIIGIISILLFFIT